jgi:AIG2-like family
VSDTALLYFAYGSNLCVEQMVERCPSGQVVGRAMLPDHALVFPRRSVRRNCGVASITASLGSVVWGAVYRLTPADIANLDGCEGYAATRDPGENAYNKHDVAVLRDGIPGGGIRVFTYIAISVPGRHLPSADYRGLMIQGAYQHRLPPSYVAALEALEIA